MNEFWNIRVNGDGIDKNGYDYLDLWSSSWLTLLFGKKCRYTDFNRYAPLSMRYTIFTHWLSWSSFTITQSQGTEAWVFSIRAINMNFHVDNRTPIHIWPVYFQAGEGSTSWILDVLRALIHRSQHYCCGMWSQIVFKLWIYNKWRL